MKKTMIIIVLLTSVGCRKYCSEHIYADFNTIYSDVPGYYGPDKSIELSSSTGLTENLFLRKSQGKAGFSKSGCRDRHPTYTNLYFKSSIYAFNFELSFSPGYDANTITFIQKFNLFDSIETLRFSYKTETGNPDFTTWWKLDEKTNRVSRKVTHEVLDSLTTRYGTVKTVFHLTNSDMDGIKNPYAISELYFDKYKGLLRFVTVEKTIWDLKN